MAVLVALAMTALVGLTAISVDAGVMYANRNKLMNAADAAALAGVQALPDFPGQAVSIARDIAYTNGVVPGEEDIQVAADGRTLQVKVTRSVPLYFARVLGHNQQAIAASASARVASISSLKGVAPLGVPRQPFVPGQQYTLKMSPHDPSRDGSALPGNFYALALGGTGSSVYSTNLTNGYQHEIGAGEWLETEPGNMAGPTETAMRQFLAEAGDDYGYTDSDGDGLADFHPGNPRLMLVPVIDPTTADKGGRTQVQVVGFAAFWIDDYGVSGQGEIRGRFVRYLIQGDDRASADDFGLRTARLVK